MLFMSRKERDMDEECRQEKDVMRCTVKAKVVVDKDAVKVFNRNFYDRYGEQAMMPKETREWRDTLRKLQGREVVVEKFLEEDLEITLPEDIRAEEKEKTGLNVVSFVVDKVLTTARPVRYLPKNT